jgi:photosynthetic reaction center H subunit
MTMGAITGYIDVAQVTLYAFWIFFAGLIYYLRSEDKREGYPLHSDNPRERIVIQGFPFIPSPKTFLMADGHKVQAPRAEAPQGPGNATPSGNWPGAPLVPNGDPMLDGVGPAAYAMRAEKPDLCVDGSPKMVPLRNAPELSLDEQGVDPRGMTVFGIDRVAAGKVVDVWVDKAEMVARYLEVDVDGRAVLLPTTLARVDAKRGSVKAASVQARHFATAPVTAKPDEITLREEDRISAYFGSGHLYATPARAEPIL